MLSILKKYWMPIFKHPKQTIKQAMDETSAKIMFILISLYGTTYFLDRAMGQGLGDLVPLAGILVLSILYGPIGGPLPGF